MYSPHDEKVYIKLNNDSKHGQIKMQIINTGVNIKDEDIQQIFKPFYRIEKSRNRNTGEVVWDYILLNKFLKR